MKCLLYRTTLSTKSTAPACRVSRYGRSQPFRQHGRNQGDRWWMASDEQGPHQGCPASKPCRAISQCLLQTQHAAPLYSNRFHHHHHHHHHRHHHHHHRRISTTRKGTTHYNCPRKTQPQKYKKIIIINENDTTVSWNVPKKSLQKTDIKNAFTLS